VTEWAVASIPSDIAEPVDESLPPRGATLAVDDEPEEAATEAARVRTAALSPVREGDVLPAADVEPSFEPDDDESEPESEIDVPVPPVVAPPLARAVPTRGDGVQRYGEAVVRQVLGATFVREEPYEPPTRFS
jgi:DNA polymerase-3 subunit gamma/tau